MKATKFRQLIREEVKAVLGEQSNPEMDRLVKKFIEGIAQRYDYGNQDALYAVFESLKRLQMLGKDVNYRPY
jgi:hypothetical protein